MTEKPLYNDLKINSDYFDEKNVFILIALLKSSLTN